MINIFDKICEMINNVISLKLCRLIGQPSDWESSQLFIQGSNETIYGKLYKNNMDGLDSFYPVIDGIDHVLSSNQKVALFQNVAFVNSVKKTHCKVLRYKAALFP